MGYSTSKTKDGKTRHHARLGHGQTKTFDRKADALDWLDNHRRDKQRVAAGLKDEDAGPILFRDLVKLWETNFPPSQWRLDMCKYLLARWGDTFVREIKPQGFGSWLHELAGKDDRQLSEKTKSHILETARRIFNAGVEWEYLKKSPARPGVFQPPSPKRRVRAIRPFESWAEVDAVAYNCSLQGNVLVRLACATGLRCPSEIVNLRWSQIDLEKKELRVQGTKSENAPRTIPLSTQALSALQDVPRRIDGRVFGGKMKPTFDYRSWRRNEWRDALRLAGLDDRTPYEMRHTFATLALQAGAPIDAVAEVMGHSSVEITFDYYKMWTRPMSERLRAVLNTIGKETDVATGAPEALHTARP